MRLQVFKPLKKHLNAVRESIDAVGPVFARVFQEFVECRLLARRAGQFHVEVFASDFSAAEPDEFLELLKLQITGRICG
jgi:hypothetical protein